MGIAESKEVTLNLLCIIHTLTEHIKLPKFTKLMQSSTVHDIVEGVKKKK